MATARVPIPSTGSQTRRPDRVCPAGRRRRLRPVTGLAAIVLLLGACASGPERGAAGASDPPPTSVPSTDARAEAMLTIHVFQFAPKPLEVHAGQTVRVVNQDDIEHTFTSGVRDAPDGHFDIDLDGPGSTGTVRLDRRGTYAYHCSIHPGMDGSIVVS